MTLEHAIKPEVYPSVSWDELVKAVGSQGLSTVFEDGNFDAVLDMYCCKPFQLSVPGFCTVSQLDPYDLKFY